MEIDNINKNEINIFFDCIIHDENKKKKDNSLNRSARKIYIDRLSYTRVNNNIGEYCQVIDATGSGNAIWYLYNSPKEGLGFIINSNKYWSWQKKYDNGIIQII
jgi:hypothetical protein